MEDMLSMSFYQYYTTITIVANSNQLSIATCLTYTPPSIQPEVERTTSNCSLKPNELNTRWSPFSSSRINALQNQSQSCNVTKYISQNFNIRINCPYSNNVSYITIKTITSQDYIESLLWSHFIEITKSRTVHPSS